MRLGIFVVLAASALTAGCNGTPDSTDGADGSGPAPDGSVPEAGIIPSVDAADADATIPTPDATIPTADAAKDATPDAEDAGSTGEAGPACTPGGSCSQPNVCKNGQYVCGDGGLTCAATTDVPDGTVCGTGKVCSAGSCVSCATGTDCTPADSCVRKTVSCTTGAPVCAADGNEPNGTSCGAHLYCNNGVCAACTPSAACVPPSNACHVGTTSCASGVATCTDTGTAAPNGTSCGTNEVCSGGACVACTAGLSCTPANVCHTGTTSCVSGASTCTDSGTTVANGTSCGTNQVCDNGACSACTAGLSCTPANVCHTGTTSCASGASTCTDTGAAAPNGTSCGTGEVCNSGTCGACVPKTCQTAGASCGTPPDGCGHLLASCGSCSAPATCGAGGVAFQCACPSGTWTAGPALGGGLYGTSIVTYGTRVDMAVSEFDIGPQPPFSAIVRTAALPGLGTWTPSVVEGGSGMVSAPALAVDPNGVDHAVYPMSGPGTNTWLLHESTGAGTTWTTTQIASGGLTFCTDKPSPGVTIDSGGTVHVLYDSCEDGHEHYASRASGQTTWQNTTLALGPSTPSEIAFDMLGGLYAFVGTKDPKVQILLGYRAPGLAWPSTFTAIDPAGAVTTNPGTNSASVAAASVAVDASGTAYVAYATSVLSAQSLQTTQTIRVGVQPSGGSWSFTTLDGPSGSSATTPARPVALTLSATGVAHVAYVVGDGSKLVHAVRGNTGWTSETVDTTGGLSDVSIAVDAAGGVEIAYASKVISYAYRCP